MKKIIFLSLLFGIFFQTNANRDDVREFNYSTTIEGNYNVYVKTVNKACNNNETEYKGNIFDILNFSGDSGVSCSKLNGSLRCNATPTGYSNSSTPPGLKTFGFSLNSTKSEILSKIGVPSKLLSGISGNYSQSLTAQLALIRDDSNGLNQDRDTNFQFKNLGNPIPLFSNGSKIEYYDESECYVARASDVSETSSGSVATRTPPESCNGPSCQINISSVDNVCSGRNPCFTTGNTSPELEYVELDGCESKNGVFYCKSGENKLNLKLKLQTLGTYGGIKKLDVNVNNWANNGPAIALHSAHGKIVNVLNTSPIVIGIDGDSYLDFKKVGNYTLEIAGFGNDTDTASRTNVLNVKVKIIPNNSFVLNGGLSVTTTSSTYANNLNSKTICGNVTDSNGNNLGLTRGVTVGIVDGINTDRVGNTGVEGLSITSKSFYSSNSKICFTIKSAAPAKKDLKFNISLQKHNDFYDGTTMNYTTMPDLSVGSVEFKKPYVGNLLVSNDLGNTWIAKPEIGTSMNYRINLTKNVTLSNSSNPTFLNYSSYIKTLGDNLTIQGLTTPTLTNVSSFSLRLNTTTGASIQPGIIIKNGANNSPIVINYTLGGKNVKYYLSTLDSANDLTPLSITGNSNSFLGVKVVGSLQATGKQELTGQSSNFTDLSKSDLRTQIRKNAYNFVKSMSGNTISNNVKYVVGNYTIEPNPTYETLVVKDGNVIINRNITNSKFGIIVLKDSYDVNNGYEAGNIIVLPSVISLNGLFYADGGFVSGNANGDIYTTDSTTRTNALKNQLTLNGSLFTRNTIGGAILGTSGKYILPGGSETIDFNKAMVYDLNYVRRGINGWDLNGNGALNSGEYNNYGFIVKYNPNLIISSPKLFNLK